MFIPFLYKFQVTVCPSSGEITVSMWHLVFVTLCGWLSGMRRGIPPCRSETCIADGHLHTVISTRCCIDTIDSPDDEHWVARNMYRSEINTLKKCVKFVINTNCTEMHSQQNVTHCNIVFSLLVWIKRIQFTRFLHTLHFARQKKVGRGHKTIRGGITYLEWSSTVTGLSEKYSASRAWLCCSATGTRVIRLPVKLRVWRCCGVCSKYSGRSVSCVYERSKACT
jgi:hypothetical protein